MATQNLLNKLTFQDVQAMYASYYTLKPEHILLDDLLRILAQATIPVDNVREFYNKAILKYYPNEATIKAEFLKRILFKKKHDITIFELPVGKSRVDLCKVNGASIAYEIKTDLDSLKRLDKQIADYQKVFEQVYIICSVQRLPEIEARIPDNCGIYAYTYSNRGHYQFEEKKEARESRMFDTRQQLNLFWAGELKDTFPECTHRCKNDTIEYILLNYSSDDINSAFKETLKRRFSRQWSFLEHNYERIYEIDYQWFYQNQTKPELIYGI